MPHVDEGLLHAYLDGALEAIDDAAGRQRGTTRAEVDAHLAHCADCRTLFDAERTVREGAAAILGGLPPVDVPAFETLQSAGASTRVRHVRALPFAWAATVVLALGVGWWGSELRQRGAVVLDEPAMSRAPAAAPVQPGRMDEAAADGALARNVERPAAAPVNSAAAADDRAGDAAAPRTQRRAVDDARVSSEQQQRAEREEAPPAVGRTAALNAVRDSALALQELVVTGSPVRLPAANETAAQRVPDTARLAQQRPPVAAAPPPPVMSLQDARGADALRLRAGAQEAAKAAAPDAAALEAFRGALAADERQRLTWTPAPATAAAPVVIAAAGAPRVHTAWFGAAALTRVTQHLDGTDVELILWRSPAASLHALAAGDQNDGAPRFRLLQQSFARDTTVQRSELQVYLEDTGELIALRAALPADTLRALLPRLRLR